LSNEINNILIVDDEVDICYLIKSVLKRNTVATIDLCNSVSKAMEKLEENDYDLAFFDMRLNDGTGEDLINHIHAKDDKQLPYIALISAYTSQADLDYFSTLKIDQFIAKPLSSKEIINCYLSASERNS
jgi:two-component SAPR family response regulator